MNSRSLSSQSKPRTRFVVVIAERKREGRLAVHGPFRSFAAAERRSDQFRKRVEALDLDVMVYVERICPGSESVADVLGAWHG